MGSGSARSLFPAPNFFMEAMVLNFRTLLAIVIAAAVIGAIGLTIYFVSRRKHR